MLAVQNDFGYRVTTVVAMGQGEPFHNYDSVIDALRYLNSKDGLQIGARHITLSTCGILPGIRKLSTEPEQFTLAISLHSAIQSTRDYLMPRCSQMPLTHLKDELVTYTFAITFSAISTLSLLIISREVNLSRAIRRHLTLGSQLFNLMEKNALLGIHEDPTSTEPVDN